jgi:hypothetical protein
VRASGAIRNVQIRNVQRRDCREGGERIATRWTSGDGRERKVAPVESKVSTTPAATEGLEALYRGSGRGRLERKQQRTSGAAATHVALPCMSILSQRVRVFGVAHSTSFDEENAQGESGAAPSAARLSPSAKMSARLILFTLTDPILAVRLDNSHYRVSQMEDVTSLTAECDPCYHTPASRESANLDANASGPCSRRSWARHSQQTSGRASRLCRPHSGPTRQRHSRRRSASKC